MKKLVNILGVIVLVLAVLAIVATVICHCKPDSCLSVKLKELSGKCCCCHCKEEPNA
ncbi:MAG: hypothetical protein VB055_01400 [Oscillospiraceae bacterium]|nr:hypothetical protein [Oscillospiraceae bacterium]